MIVLKHFGCHNIRRQRFAHIASFTAFFPCSTKFTYCKRHWTLRKIGKDTKAAHIFLVQCSIKAYANLLWTLSFQLLFSKPHTGSSNVLNTLELHATSLTPDLARYLYIHSSDLCKKRKNSWQFYLFWPKTTSVFYSCLCFLTRMTKFDIERFCQWVNNTADPATAATPAKHICTTSHMATNVFDVICLATIDTNHLQVL